MFKNEKGISYINWVIILLVVLILAVIVVRVLVGDTGLIQQKKDEEMRNKTERNIMIQLINETRYN